MFLTGYNNENYVLDIKSDKALLRIPCERSGYTDIRLLDEGEVLTFLKGKVNYVPDIIFGDPYKGIMVEEYIDGTSLNKYFDAFEPIPNKYICKLAEIMRDLHEITGAENAFELPSEYRDAPSFFNFVSSQIKDVCMKLYDKAPNLYEKLGLWWKDVDLMFSHLPEMSDQRSLALCHCDLHRGNILLSGHDDLYFLDWELALIGDPAYDLAIHFQKMRYSDEEIEFFLDNYLRGRTDPAVERFKKGVSIYKKMEAVKYAFVDIWHIIDKVKANQNVTDVELDKYYVKLCNAYEVLGQYDGLSMDSLKEVVRFINHFI